MDSLNVMCENNVATFLAYITSIIYKYFTQDENYWHVDELTQRMTQMDVIKTLKKHADYYFLEGFDILCEENKGIVLTWLFKFIYTKLAIQQDRSSDFHLLKVDHILETFFLPAEDEYDKDAEYLCYSQFDELMFELIGVDRRDDLLIDVILQFTDLQRLIDYLNKYADTLNYDILERNFDILQYLVQNSLMNNYTDGNTWLGLCEDYAIIFHHFQSIITIIETFQLVSISEQPRFDIEIVMKKLLKDWLPTFDNDDNQQNLFYNNSISTFLKPLDYIQYVKKHTSKVDVYNDAFVLKEILGDENYVIVEYQCRKTLYQIIDEDKFTGLRISACLDLISNVLRVQFKYTEFKDRHVLTRDDVINNINFTMNESRENPLLINIVSQLWCVIYKSSIYCLGAGVFQLIGTFFHFHPILHKIFNVYERDFI